MKNDQTLSDSEFLRYSRQLLLEDIGPEGQRKLKGASVLIVGLGGLGSPAALYLAAAGVGQLLLADDDQLDLTNLQRQILYRTADIGQTLSNPTSSVSHNKARLAQRHLQQLNPQIRIVALDTRLTGQVLTDAVANADLVLDCSDNMETRHQVNAACVTAQKPLISGSAVGFSGQLLVIEPPYAQGCYACIYPDKELPQRNCRTAGVLGPVSSVPCRRWKPLKCSREYHCKLRLFDGKQQSWSTLQLTRAAHCPACGGGL